MPMIFVALYYLVSTTTLFLKKGFATVRFSCSSLKQGKRTPEQVTKGKDLEEECVLIRAFHSTDARESEDNDQNIQPRFKHESQCFESEV